MLFHSLSISYFVACFFFNSLFHILVIKNGHKIVCPKPLSDKKGATLQLVLYYLQIEWVYFVSKPLTFYL